MRRTYYGGIILYYPYITIIFALTSLQGALKIGSQNSNNYLSFREPELLQTQKNASKCICLFVKSQDKSLLPVSDTQQQYRVAKVTYYY